MLPLFFNLADRLAVIVGGGPVGRRKAAAVLAAGGRVRLVCLERCPQAEPVDARLDWLVEPYQPRHLDGAALVFAAATRDVNRQVAADAHDRGLWVNAATEPGQGDFFLPATLRRGELVVALSTGGAAPGLARTLRQHLEEHLDDAFARWVELLTEMRGLVQTQVEDEERRRRILERLCAWSWVERLRQEGVEAVRQAMLGEIGERH